MGVFEITHKYDKAVEFLLHYKIGDIPLPYYILLKSAHDILKEFYYNGNLLNNYSNYSVLSVISPYI